LKGISTDTDLDVLVDLYDEDSVDGSDDEHEDMEIVGSLPKKASSLAHTSSNRLEPGQDIGEAIDWEEEQNSTSRAEIDAASGLYKQMCDLRQQVS
jgi:hypothetical protein